MSLWSSFDPNYSPLEPVPLLLAHIRPRRWVVSRRASYNQRSRCCTLRGKKVPQTLIVFSYRYFQKGTFPLEWHYKDMGQVPGCGPPSWVSDMFLGLRLRSTDPRWVWFSQGVGSGVEETNTSHRTHDLVLWQEIVKSFCSSQIHYEP